MGQRSQHPRQIPCFITHTNDQTHEIIETISIAVQCILELLKELARVIAHQLKIR